MELTAFLKRLPVVWLWLVLVFLASGLIINIIQLLLLPLWFINKDLFRWINMNAVYFHWCQLTFLAEWWSGLNIKLYGTKEDMEKLGKESAICLSNHRSDVDWLIGYIVADRAGILGVEIVRQTQDLNVHVIIIDYESNDINIEATLERSSLRSFTVVKMPAKERFQRALALQRGAQTVTDPHSIIFLSDLHLKIPPKLITTIPKHCVEGKMAFAPVVKRLRCGYYPDLPLGYWETLGFGLLAIYKSDFDRVGGMNIKEFTEWGGEDWELLDRILMSGLEVERLKIPDFYHFYHPALGKSHQRVGA